MVKTGRDGNESRREGCIADNNIQGNQEFQVFWNLGNVYHSHGDFKKAGHYHERCLEIARKVGDVSTEGVVCCSLGNDYVKLGDYKKAIQYNERGLEIVKKVGKVSDEGKVYCNLGSIYAELGDFEKAIHYHERCLEIVIKVGDVSIEGMVYGNLGMDYGNFGDSKKAIHYHERSLDIARRMGDISSEGAAYGNLGQDYSNLGDFKKAIHYLERSLKIAREVGDVSREGTAYNNLGSVYSELGDFKKAIENHERDLEIARKVGNISSEGRAYNNLGTVYQDLGEFKTALHYYKRCLGIVRKVGKVSDEGKVCGNLATNYAQLGDFENAIRCHESCLEIARKVGDVSTEGKAYGNLGRDFARVGDFQKAIHYDQQGLKIAEKLGDKVTKGQIFHNLGFDFESTGCLSKAVECYEKSITELNDVRRDLAFNDDWKVSLCNLYQITYVSLWRLLLKHGEIVNALLSAEQGRAQALRDLMEFKYASKNTQAESWIEMKPDDLSGFTSNTVFIALETQEVILWVLRKGKNVQLRRKQIPDGDVDAETFLHTTLKKLRGRADVKCEDRSLNITEAERSPSDERQNQSSNPWNSALSLLHEIVISPIQDLLLDNEVIFVPEGPLCLAPFAAFLDSDSKYLCESFRVRIIPSLTSWKLIAVYSADYHIKGGALLVGDPWIQEVTFEETKFPQLPFARKEAQMIGRILHTTPLIGEHAIKKEVLKRLSSVALVHIAAHGRMETGEILLAPNPSPVSRTPIEEEFLLTMRDVLNVQMRARLVVLSCCHSARGEIKAEGVVGIARAFLGAGARSVLVSLWAIDDEATMKFMKIFYQHLFKGESASAALNQAMKSMRESDEFSAVNYWAPFVLIGDDVTLELGGQE